MLGGWSPPAPSAARVKEVSPEDGLKEFNLAALNHPQEQAAFPSPSKGGGMTGFLISEPRVRERSHPPELSCLRCFPCRVQLPLGGR